MDREEVTYIGSRGEFGTWLAENSIGGIVMVTGEASETVLATCSVCFGGMHIDYRLIARAPARARSYWIGICMGRERNEAFLGDRLEPAIEKYQRLVYGCVTPCSLDALLGSRFP